MTKQQKQIEFNKRLASFKIHETIKQLESNLKLYQLAKNNYLVQIQILEIQQTILMFECQLKDLIEI